MKKISERILPICLLIAAAHFVNAGIGIGMPAGFKDAAGKLDRKLSGCTPHGQTTFTTPGTYIFIACSNSATVQVWGGGGGGSADGLVGGDLCGNPHGNSIISGAGGGGGGYGSQTFNLSPGNSYTVTVGTGGAGAIETCLRFAGSDGGASSFGTLISATGGQGATYISISSPTPSPGLGGISAASTNVSGQPGTSGTSFSGPNSSCGGNGGASANGGAGGTCAYGTLKSCASGDIYDPLGAGYCYSPASAPGGGGAGNGNGNNESIFSASNLNGATGQVSVSW